MICSFDRCKYGFSRSLFADQKFYDGFSRGDESAFKSALVKNRDFKFILVTKLSCTMHFHLH